MMPKQNPFSLYDFLGYFVPGAAFLYGLILMEVLFDPNADLRKLLTRYLDVEHPDTYIPFVIAAYVCGHILSFISSISVERYSVWTLGYPSKYLLRVKVDKFFEAEDPKILRRLFRVVTALALAPVMAFDVIVGRFLHARELYARPLDKLLVEVVRKKIQRLILDHCEIKHPSEHGNVKETDFFRLVYHYVQERAPHHVPKMQNYVALYGFLRTICFMLVLLWWRVLIGSPAACLTGGYARVFVGVTVLSFVAYMGFVKFYRRFTLEALMALTAILPPGTTPSPSGAESG